MKRLNEMRLWGDPYQGIRLQDLSPEQATNLLETLEILHDWVTDTYGVVIHEYLREFQRTEEVDDDEMDEDF